MSMPPDMAERHARVLARLTEMGLALAERTFEDAQAAWRDLPDPADPTYPEAGDPFAPPPDPGGPEPQPQSSA